MNFKSTILAAAAVAFSAISAHAVTLNVGYDIDVINEVDGSIDLDFNLTLMNDDFDIDQAFNLRSATEIQLDPKVMGTGSLTVSTYVDPFASTGLGGAQILFSQDAGNLAEDAVTVKWGDGDAVNLVAGSTVALNTIFTEAGLDGAQDLVFTWTGLNTVEQVSANIAAVPLPAGVLLLGTALAGLGIARRRKS